MNKKRRTKIEEIRDHLEDLKSQIDELHSLGADAFPMCECDKFCYKNGCRGHLITGSDV